MRETFDGHSREAASSDGADIHSAGIPRTVDGEIPVRIRRPPGLRWMLPWNRLVRPGRPKRSHTGTTPTRRRRKQKRMSLTSVSSPFVIEAVEWLRTVVAFDKP
jgi:hypothetical protein